MSVVWWDRSGEPPSPHEVRGPYLVYTHVCPNGKVYVGLTRQSELARWENGHAYKDNAPFYADIQKYGWENFIHRIEFRDMSERDALYLESMLISFENSCNPACGYNRATFGTAGWNPTEEQREHLSSVRKAYVSEHPEAVERLAETHRGVPRPESTKEKIRAALADVPKSEEHRRNIAEGIARHREVRPVRCVETGEEYRSAWDAHLRTDIGDAGIARCCKGQAKTAGGFHWEYALPKEADDAALEPHESITEERK